MRSENQASARAGERRQRLQVAAGVLAVAVIWTLALWPTGPDQPSQPSTQPRHSLRPWTTGPFIGTTPSSGAGTTVSPSTAPALPAPTAAKPSRWATSPVVRRPAPVATTPVATRTPSTTTSPSRGNRPPRPPGQQ